MFQSDLSGHRQLFAFSTSDMVADDCDVWLYLDLFSKLDFSEFDADYSSQGQAAKPPELMLRTIFYGLIHGIVSGRRLADACRHDVRFILLSGELRPDARTFHRFLLRHAGRFPDLFAQVVRLAQAMGLVKLGRIAVDGSRFKANTSKHKAMSHERMIKAVEQLKAELEELRASLAEENAKHAAEASSSLPEEIARREDRLAKIEAAKRALEAEKGEGLKPRDQKSFNDHDALPMAGKGKGFEYGYNCQAAVDDESQIVVAAETHNNQSDAGVVGKILDATEETCGQRPEALLADSAYGSCADLNEVEKRGIEPFVAIGKGEHAKPQGVADQLVAVEDEDHAFQCISGKLLPVQTKHKDGSTTLMFPKSFCNNCPYADFCCVRSKGGKPFKVKPVGDHELIRSHRARMRSEQGSEIYKQRKAIVEPVFGNIKNKGMRILVTGREKVAVWWKIAATAHNIEKIIARLGAGSATRAPIFRERITGTSPVFA